MIRRRTRIPALPRRSAPRRSAPLWSLVLLTGALCCAASPILHAQAEYVPAVHPVYDLLDRMQIRGLLDGYSRAALPLTRGRVTAFLRTLDSLAALPSATERITAAERARIARAHDEFVAEADGTQRPVVLFGSGEGAEPVLRGVFSDREKYLYRWRSDDGATTFHMEGLASLELRSAPGAAVPGPVAIGQVGGAFRGTIGGSFGYGLQATNGTVFGDRAFALSDRILRQNANFSDFGNDYFDLTEAWVSAAWQWGDAALGKQTLLYGNGLMARVLVGTNAPPFDAIRLNVHAGAFRFSFLHGFLLSRPEEADGRLRPVYPDKFVAMHRAEADLFDAVRFGVFETVIYSHRSVDPAYLNPVNFYKSAEHAGGDRDNPLLGVDLATLFLDGHQFYGSWTIDDVDFSRLGTHWWGNKFLWNAGAVSHALLPDGEVAVEYTRIEPYVFSHTELDNDVTHKGYALALDLQPNSDEWQLRVRRWFGADVSASVTAQYRRHGGNVVRDDSVLVVNNGGDIAERFVWGRDAEYLPFLSGPVDTQAALTVHVRWEVVRNVVLDAVFRHRRFGGPRLVDRDSFVSLLLDIRF